MHTAPSDMTSQDSNSDLSYAKGLAQLYLVKEALSGLESDGFVPFVSTPQLGHTLSPLCGPDP